MSTTLKQIIIQECANYVDGKCLGADCLNKRIFNPTGHCLVMEKKRCEYFEQCLLPDYIKNNAKIVKAYAKINPDYIIRDRKCTCGALLPPRRRICDDCARKNRRKSWRISKWEKRKKQGGMSQVKEISPYVDHHYEPVPRGDDFEKLGVWDKNTNIPKNESLTVDKKD